MRRLALVTAAVLSTSALVPFAAAAPRCGDEATLTISNSNSLRTTDDADKTLHVTNDSSDAVTLTLDDSKGTGTACFDETQSLRIPRRTSTSISPRTATTRSRSA